MQFVRRILVEQDGQATMIIVVFMALFLLGFVALGLDVGLLFHEQRMAQAAADAAAVAAAEEMPYGQTAENNAAVTMAKLNGFDNSLATNPATVSAPSAPKSGNYAGSSSYVEVDVSKPIHTFFLGTLNHSASTITVSARAVAGGGAAVPTCVCLEGPAGQDLNMSNNAKLSAPQCGIIDNSSSNNAVGVVGSASVSAVSLGTVSSTWNNSSNLNSNVNNNGSISSSTKIVTGITNTCSSSVTAPALPNGLPCYSNPIQGWIAPNYNGLYTLPLAGEATSGGVVCYTSLNTSQSAAVTFSPGYTYYIQGDFTTGGGAPLTGSGVTFYVGGNINIANGVTVNLSAPTVNGVPQTLFYAMGSSVTIQGGSSSNLSGLIDAPNAAVNLNNGTGTTLNMDLVAQSLTMAGGATLNSYANSSLGSLGVTVAKLAE